MKLNDFSAKLKTIPLTRGFVEQIDILSERYGEEYIGLAEDILTMFDSLGIDPIVTARRYIYDYLKQLDLFLKNGDYGHFNYEEITDDIYFNKSVMLDTYFPGLLLSYAYTTILYEKNHLFLSEFIPRITDGMKGLEVGFGEGFYLWETFNKNSNIFIEGYDISPYAVEFAVNMLEKSGHSPCKWQLSVGNLLEGLPVENESMDFAIFAEVLEHIPTPELGLYELIKCIKKGGILYLTTVRDSNHMDHISNFESSEVVEKMIRSHSMNIIAKSEYRMKDDFPKTKDISVGLAFVARKE